MIIHSPLVLCNEDQKETTDLSSCEIVFIEQTESLSLDCLSAHQRNLEHLIYQILSNPKNLTTHIHRINYCFKYNNPDQLYAALVDFFIVLSGKGDVLCLRMYKGAKSRLTEEQNKLLLDYLDKKKDLQDSRFSVFGKGLIGSSRVVTKTLDV